MSAERSQNNLWQAAMPLSKLTGERGDEDPTIIGLTPDSRMVKPGFLFAAIKGDLFDGEAFIPQAIEAGAVAILSANPVDVEVPVIVDDNPRLRLARMAAIFHAGAPATIVGITGTNGKTSVANFTQQLWAALGLQAGALGTLGAFAPGYDYSLRHTTPDPVEIHQVLSTMAALGTTHLAMEVSSHGLAQYRADAVPFSHGAFCNLTQDHLDFHKDFNDYFKAKLRLFTALLPDDGVAVVNRDGAEAERLIELLQAQGRKIFTVGKSSENDIVLENVMSTSSGIEMAVTVDGYGFEMVLPLFGDFQAENALVAAGLVIASGYDAEQVLPLLATLRGAPGRMELVGKRAFSEGSASLYVDFAHTPDALQRALASIRPHASGKIHLVFGAGGDRDKSKRSLMGAAAFSGADHIIITDDNPRFEKPAEIRAEIAKNCPGAEVIADRRAAIMAGVKALAPGDVLLIAGKGHESGQSVGAETLPFNDRVVAVECLAQLGEG